jgi:hypothetical protein
VGSQPVPWATVRSVRSSNSAMRGGARPKPRSTQFNGGRVDFQAALVESQPLILSARCCLHSVKQVCDSECALSEQQSMAAGVHGTYSNITMLFSLLMDGIFTRRLDNNLQSHSNNSGEYFKLILSKEVRAVDRAHWYWYFAPGGRLASRASPIPCTSASSPTSVLTNAANGPPATSEMPLLAPSGPRERAVAPTGSKLGRVAEALLALAIDGATLSRRDAAGVPKTWRGASGENGMAREGRG